MEWKGRQRRVLPLLPVSSGAEVENQKGVTTEIGNVALQSPHRFGIAAAELPLAAPW